MELVERRLRQRELALQPVVDRPHVAEGDPLVSPMLEGARDVELTELCRDSMRALPQPLLQEVYGGLAKERQTVLAEVVDA